MRVLAMLLGTNLQCWPIVSDKHSHVRATAKSGRLNHREGIANLWLPLRSVLSLMLYWSVTTLRSSRRLISKLTVCAVASGAQLCLCSSALIRLYLVRVLDWD